VSGYCIIATAWGPLGLAWSEVGLLRVQLTDIDGATTKGRLLHKLPEPEEADPPDWLAPTTTELQRYFSGKPVAFSAIPLDLEKIAPFHRAVYDQTLLVGFGHTVTYGELAARAGQPGAAQAVGQAMGRNPMPVIIPCHRVLASNNKLGGFSAPGGQTTKLMLLDLEGVRLGRNNPAQYVFPF